jgi:hypothetical protein
VKLRGLTNNELRYTQEVKSKKKNKCKHEQTVLAVVVESVNQHGLTTTAIREAYLLGLVDGARDSDLADYALKQLTEE